MKILNGIPHSPYNYNDEVLKCDFGMPSKGESEGLKKENQLARVIYIATQLGIELPKESAEINCYELIT